MASEGFPKGYGSSSGAGDNTGSLDDVRYGAQGSTPVVEGNPAGYEPFSYPEREDLLYDTPTPQLQAGGAMQPPGDRPEKLSGTGGEDGDSTSSANDRIRRALSHRVDDEASADRSLQIEREDGQVVEIRIVD